jgi:hypothetical protein
LQERAGAFRQIAFTLGIGFSVPVTLAPAALFSGLWIAEAKLAKSRTICHALRVPKVLEKDGFGFFFYSNDRAPIHIHVRRGGGEAVFDLDNDVELWESQGMKLSDIAKAEAIATEYKQLMIKKWHEHLD